MPREIITHTYPLYPSLSCCAPYRLRQQNGDTPALFAARRGRSAILDALLEAKGDPNAKNNVRRAKGECRWGCEYDEVEVR